jgi:hypothetical protein
MASVEECRAAIASLAADLAAVDAELRNRHVPERSLACRLTDLEVTFVGRLDEHGLHDIATVDGADPSADVRITMTSDELVGLAAGRSDFLHGWLRGRIQVAASVRDLLRLRSLFGL